MMTVIVTLQRAVFFSVGDSQIYTVESSSFLIGIAWLGIFALGCGFAGTASELLVLRGLQGIGSAAVVPSSVRVLI